MLRHFSGVYSPEEISVAIQLWNDYSNEEEPGLKKAGVFPAAIEYFICQMYGYDVTQTMLAEKYNVSAGTISQRAGQIMAYTTGKAEQFDTPELTFQQPVNSSGRLGMEKEMYDLGALLENQNFATIEEANAFLNRHLNNPKQTNAKKALSSKEKAQDLLYTAWDEPSSIKRIQLANQALDLYPNSADAYNILAENDAGNLKEAAQYFKQGILVGEKELGEAFIKKNKGHFWGITSTRPYMRAKLGYANTCSQMGKEQEAIQHYTELLELNPNDNQGVRDMLSLSYLETEQWKKAADLHKKYQEDASASLNYDRVLVEYGLHGITTKLNKLLSSAIQQNPHVTSYLIGKKRIPRELPEYIGFGDDNEAISYAHTHRHLWKNKSELVNYLTH
jgi:tetratricopeptide (TPR) repeat protein